MSNKVSRYFHKIIKKIIYPSPMSGEDCTLVIKRELEKKGPTMIARFGSTEIKAIIFPTLPFFLRPFLKKRIFENMYTLSGFFPSNKQTIKQFSSLMIEDMKLLDVLGCWRIEESLLQKYFPFAKRVELDTLEPYLQKNPWSELLENKKILVIHPFSDTIESQYHKRRKNCLLTTESYRSLSL